MLPIRHCKLLALFLVAGRGQMTHTETEQNKPKTLCAAERSLCKSATILCCDHLHHRGQCPPVTFPSRLSRNGGLSFCAVLRDKKLWLRLFFCCFFVTSLLNPVCVTAGLTLGSQQLRSQPASLQLPLLRPHAEHWMPSVVLAGRRQMAERLQLQEPRSPGLNIEVNPLHLGQSSLLYNS